MSISEQYFLGQHYGLPTRLLDWTTNPLTALFFAVSSNEYIKEDGAFFCFFSRKDISGYEHEDILYNFRDHERLNFLIEEILYKKTEKTFYKYPVRIIPNNQFGRIMSQNSRFTLHLEESMQYGEYSGVIKIKIPWKYKTNILKELSLLNISRSALFMDMESIVADIKNEMRI